MSPQLEISEHEVLSLILQYNANLTLCILDAIGLHANSGDASTPSSPADMLRPRHRRRHQPPAADTAADTASTTAASCTWVASRLWLGSTVSVMLSGAASRYPAHHSRQCTRHAAARAPQRGHSPLTEVHRRSNLAPRQGDCGISLSEPLTSLLSQRH
jgi:hypothetical protein